MSDAHADERPLTSRTSLVRLTRGAAPQLGLLALLYFVELMFWPLLVLFIATPWLVGAQVCVAVLARAARLALHQRARARLRTAFMVQATEDALRRHTDPEAESDSAFWGAHIMEYALCKDLPAIVGAGAGVLAASSLAATRLGWALVSEVLLIFGLATLAGFVASGLRRRAVDAIVDRRHQLAVWMAAAMRDGGEISSRRAVTRFLAAIEHRALAWCRAEELLEGRRALHRSAIVAITLGALFLLARELNLPVAGGLAGASDNSFSDLILLGTVMPAAYSLLGHLESLNVARTELKRILPRELALRPVGTLQPARRPRTLRVRDVRVVYGEHLALAIDELALDLSRPLLITGPNGAGKTTLAALIAGVTLPTTGALELDGVAPHSLAPESVAFVPQDPVLIEALTVFENVQLVAPDCSRDEARLVLRRLGMNRAETALDAAAGTFSRGERRRIAVARALLKRPQLLVLDEPDAWLDTPGRAELREALLQLSHDCAVVVVSHRSEEMTGFGCVIVLSAAHRLESRDGVARAPARSSPLESGTDQPLALAEAGVGTSSA